MLQERDGGQHHGMRDLAIDGPDDQRIAVLQLAQHRALILGAKQVLGHRQRHCLGVGHVGADRGLVRRTHAHPAQRQDFGGSPEFLASRIGPRSADRGDDHLFVGALAIGVGIRAEQGRDHGFLRDDEVVGGEDRLDAGGPAP
jgi:hypothetical protein